MLSLEKITVIERESGESFHETVYGERFLALLYGNSWLSRLVGGLVLPLITRLPLVSALYGWLQRRPRSRRKIAPFVEKYGIDVGEFAKPVDAFSSFDDFFTRKLKPESRPIAQDEDVAIIPADGRYWFCQDIASTNSFLVKGKRYDLCELLRDSQLAKEYERGSLVMARLCPTDYHRFHFPCSGHHSKPRLIRGSLHSVNPVAVKRWIQTFTENKRTVSELESDHFGKVVSVEVGATCVGTIHHTCEPDQQVEKGEEKGYFSFGGSALILLFEPGKIRIDPDLLAASSQFLEVRCLFGQRMGQRLG